MLIQRVLFPVVLALSATSWVFAQGDKTVNITYSANGSSVTKSAVVDSGSTATGNVDGTSVPVPDSSVDRATAQSLGLINTDGSLNANLFEKDSMGNILMQEETIGDGTKFNQAVSKPISLQATDDSGKTKTVTTRVLVSPDPKKPGAILIGNNTLGTGLDATFMFKTQKITWNNSETNVPGGKKKASLDGPVVPNGALRLVFPNTTFATAGNSVTADAFIMTSSPFSIVSQTLAAQLGLTVTGTLDLTSNSALLDQLEFAGFYADSAPNFGIFNEALLPGVRLLTDDGSIVQIADLPVLIDPIGSAALLGYDFFTNPDALLDNAPITDITFISSTGDTFFSSVPEPATTFLVGFALTGVLALRFASRRMRPVIEASEKL